MIRNSTITILGRDGQPKTDTIENWLHETEIQVSDCQLTELDVYIECSVCRYYDDWTTLAEGKLKNLLAHPNVEVREWLAEHGYGLYFLINDPDSRVRQAVARRGYSLNILVHDPNRNVRIAIAEIGCCWDALIHDTDDKVRLAIANYPNRYNVKMDDEDTERYENALSVLIHDKCADVRLAIAKYGYDLDFLQNDTDVSVLLEVIKHGVVKNEFVNHSDYRIRREMAKLGCGIDTLISDSIADVRYAAIKFLLDESRCGDKFTTEEKEHYLNMVQDDESWDIQMMLLEHGYRNETFIQKVVKSKNLDSIRVLIKLGIALEELIKHPSPEVRCAVAKAGYGLERLIKDENKSVRFTAQHHIGRLVSD